MRKLKFRFYYKRDYMGQKADTIGFGGSINLNDEGHSCKMETDDYVIMQYTGLKDKNGVDIYEGDILKNMDGYYYEVVWDSGSFLVKRSKIETDYNFIASKNYFEIIGNIYQNKELLK